ncbi:hypothetical protein D7316_03766 [Gordonia insulae]|uniref:DUF202 domain-containing protein n=1 Tax=Gordonia insulae TaxID=2420509 RepID=A0A3G8JQH4_9ACTN|nr:hypothetical protein D7316_03766 [Gordonia insulae]
MRRDPGLQPERTLLAWRRTTLTAGGVLLLSGRALMLEHTVMRGATVVLCGVVVAALCGGMAVRRRRYRADPGCGKQMPAKLLVAIVLAIACAGVSMAVG